MEDKRVHLVLFFAILAINEEIGAKALPKRIFTLPHDDHTKDFIRELSKESPDFEKLGKFVKEFYFEWNGLKEAGNAYESPSSYHGNSNSTITNEDFGRNEDLQSTVPTLGGRNRRQRERDTQANVSIMFFTPPSNIPKISIGSKKKRSSNMKQLKIIDNVRNNMRVAKSAKKDMISSDKIPFSSTELSNENLVKNEKQPVPSTSIEYKGWWTLKKTLGICFILVWLQVLVLLLYQFCRKERYEKYVCLSSKSEVYEPSASEPSVSKIVNNLSSEPSSSDKAELSTEPENKLKNFFLKQPNLVKGSQGLDEKPKNNLKTLALKEPNRVKDSQGPDDLTEPKDDESPKNYRQKNIQILKNTFSQILSSEPIPQNSIPSCKTDKSKKIIIISSDPENNCSTETSIEKDENNKPKSSTPAHEDLAQTYVKQLYYDIKDPAHPELHNRSQEFSIISVDKDITTTRYLDTSHTLDDSGESLGNSMKQSQTLMESNPEMNSSVLKEHLQDPMGKSMTEEERLDFLRRTEIKQEGSSSVEENPYQEQRKKVTFNRVIKSQALSSGSKWGEIAETFHPVHDRKPCLKSPSKSESLSNFPENNPNFVYPRRTRIYRLNNDAKFKNSLFKRLKKKFKK